MAPNDRMAVGPKPVTPSEAYAAGRRGVEPKYNGMTDTVEREWGERLPVEVDAERLYPYNPEAQRKYVQGRQDSYEAEYRKQH